MKSSPSVRVWLSLGILGCIASAATWSLGLAQAQDAAVAEPAEDDDDAEPLDLTVPDGTAAELDEFIQKLAQSEPQGETEEEQIAYAKGVLTAILEAAERMLKAKPDEDQATLAVRYRLMALEGLSQLGDEEAAKRFPEEVEKAMNDPRPEIATVGWRSFLIMRLSVWDTLDDAAKEEFAAKILERVNSPKLSSLEVSIVQLVASNLDMRDDKFAAKLIADSLPAFQKSEAEDVKVALADANLEGMLRRLSLMGNTMEISGDLLGGGELDWKSYRGKVVLVDFSATWCGPCVAEAPNVLNMYQQYKDKGFDVVAISLDRTPADAEQYVKDNGIQWKTLFPSKEEDRYWNHPMVKFYGVTGIPTAILLDKDGKAVNMNARDTVLQEELQRLLGEPAPPTSDASAGRISPLVAPLSR